MSVAGGRRANELGVSRHNSGTMYISSAPPPGPLDMEAGPSFTVTTLRGRLRGAAADCRVQGAESPPTVVSWTGLMSPWILAFVGMARH